MMQIAHAISGAAAGSVAPDPVIAFIFGIAIHFLVDKVPHFWPPSKEAKKYIIIVDYLVTFVAIGIIYSTGIMTNNMIFGLAGSLVVDIVLVGIPFIAKSKIGLWHCNRQTHLEKPFTFMTDIAVIGLGFYFIYFLK